MKLLAGNHAGQASPFLPLRLLPSCPLSPPAAFTLSVLQFVHSLCSLHVSCPTRKDTLRRRRWTPDKLVARVQTWMVNIACLPIAMLKMMRILEGHPMNRPKIVSCRSQASTQLAATLTIYHHPAMISTYHASEFAHASPESFCPITSLSTLS